MAFQGIGNVASISISGSASTTGVQAQQSPYLRVVAVGASFAHVAINTSPTATTTDTVVVNNKPEVISLGQNISQSIAGIVTSVGDGVTGVATLTVPDGYGAQFVKGNLLNLTVVQGVGSTDAQTYFNATDLLVDNVIGKKVTLGDVQTKIIISGASLIGICTGLFPENTLEARKAFKVSTVGDGASNGTLYVQQVQNAGGSI
tara:strand:+ start:399 stop:1007 length:609 start_codon:yes stop_codon:yes gene_type:complete